MRKSAYGYGAILTFARLLPIAVVVLASLFLNADDFGALALLVTALSTAMLIADSGLDASATWLASRQSNDQGRSEVLAALRILRVFIASLFSAIMISPYVHYFSDTRAQASSFVFIAVLGAALSARNGAKRVGQRIVGTGEPRSILIEKSFASVFFAGWLIFVSTDIRLAGWGYLAALVIGACVASGRFRIREVRTNPKTIGQLLRSAAPFGVSAICAAWIWRSGVFYLESATGPVHAGYFVLASYPIQLASMVPVLASPLLLVRDRYDERQRESLVAKSLVIGAAMGACAFVCSLGAQAFVPHSWVDPRVFHTLAVLCISLPFLWVNPFLASLLRVRGRLWSPAAVQLSGAILASFAGLLLVKYDAVGVAIAIVLAESAIAFGLRACVGRLESAR